MLYVHPRNPHPYLNYAIPLPGLTGGGGEALLAAARERGLVPRLEYVEPCYPWVEDALAGAGFTREARLRLMSVTPARISARPPDTQLLRIPAGSENVRGLLDATHAAFGEPEATDADVAGWDGRGVAAMIDGEVVGGASWTPVIDGISEIVGVGVAPAHRRRGIGGTLTAGAARSAFEDGAELAILTPGDEGSARVYERAGFIDTTSMLHLRAADSA